MARGLLFYRRSLGSGGAAWPGRSRHEKGGSSARRRDRGRPPGAPRRRPRAVDRLRGHAALDVGHGLQRGGGRGLPAVAYDPVERVAGLFGGYDSGGLRSDTWEYDVVANTWSETTPASSPPTMVSNALAYAASPARPPPVGW